jgi:hypothetical protein
VAEADIELADHVRAEQRTRAVGGSEHPRGDELAIGGDRVGFPIRPNGRRVTPGAAAPRDTSRAAPRGPRLWRRWIASLGTISTDAGFSEQSGYSRLKGTPGFPYLFGVSSDPGFESDSTGGVQEQFGNVSNTSRDWHASAHTRLLLLLGTSLSTKVDYRRQLSNVNDVTSRTDLVGFPDLDFDYGRIPDVIGLSKVLTNPKLRSVYRRSSTTLYSNSEEPTSIATSSQWQPLLGLTGDFKSGTRAEFSCRASSHRAQVVSARDVGQLDRDGSQYRREREPEPLVHAGPKDRVPWQGIDDSQQRHVAFVERLLASFRRNDPDAQRCDAGCPVRGERRPPVGQRRWLVRLQRQRHRNVDLGFSQNRDLQKAIVRRSIRVAVQAQFTF